MAGWSFQHLLSFLLLLLLCAKPGLGNLTGCIERERQALLHFKRGLVDEFGLLSSWGDDNRDCCQWSGVQCSNQSGHIIMLHLPAPPNEDYAQYDGYQSLRGEISPWLLELEHLTHLDLSYNDFEGRHIPPFLGSLSRMQYLDLSQANLAQTVPTQLGNLSNLLSLDLSDNYYLNFGNLEWLSRLSSLRRLDLSSVDLSKAIHWSQAINKLPSLIHLDLQNCGLPPIPPLTIPSLSHGNSSVPLVFLDLSSNPLTSSIYPWLLNFSTTLLHLDLQWNDLHDEIPDTIGDMGSLVYLDLSCNQLQGFIPDTIGKMVLLSHLDLSLNQLQGSIPDTVGNMVSLKNLYLSQNHLQGEIPKSLSNLCNLQELELDRNNLSGQLAPDFVACANDTLETLFLSDNQFSGSVPALIGFSSLRELHLDFNQLNGTLPESVGQLAKLESLDIASNSLQGTISEAHLFNMSRLSYLNLSSNSLTFNMSLEWVPPFQLYSLRLAFCKLGPRFPSWLRTQNLLRELDISNSEISDALPDWFWNVTISTVTTLSISNNRIKGTLPNLSSKFDRFSNIDMSSNYFEGSIPQLPYDVRWLDLSNNKLSGSISLLCTVGTELLLLDLSNNSLSGGLPNCWAQWESLVVLNLENNRFSGQIPNSFGSLRSIQTLHLRNNNLTGELPLSFKNCTSLRFIDLAKNRLSGKIPEWIGGSLPNLTVLNLGSNRFSGGICPELCQLKNIQILDLSSNNMLGVVPRCVGGFTAMTKKGSLVIVHNYSFAVFAGKLPQSLRNASYVDRALVKWKGREFEYKSTLGLVKSIDFSSNKLSGEIPEEVIDLVELVSLNLSRNNLTRLIPTRIGQLKSLEVLDLSQNQLFGEIPASLVEISDLSVLDLSDNNLSGQIPQGTQLQSFNIDSYKGNPALCGLPLLKKCFEDKIKQDSPTHNIEDKIQQDGNDMWFYVSVALGFIVGFWGVCGTLLLNNSWRYAYFQFLNKIKDWLYVIIAINMARLQRSLQS
ncbi:receptor-like protein EIX1 isoform X2 [Vitis riparia]|uniref:receptor-like protein EIX1 isoform X2 n=1 Tax=Vitis riparia TaxID=96939 RepID=UPI00155A7AB3|nr:receptor-like protein EIX1 isoform X2 [Vitis riparia]